MRPARCAWSSKWRTSWLGSAVLVSHFGRDLTNGVTILIVCVPSNMLTFYPCGKYSSPCWPQLGFLKADAAGLSVFVLLLVFKNFVGPSEP